MDHKCKESTDCICSTTALEPNWDCPKHGEPWPPRCGICGRFMPWRVARTPAQENYLEQ